METLVQHLRTLTNVMGIIAQNDRNVPSDTKSAKLGRILDFLHVVDLPLRCSNDSKIGMVLDYNNYRHRVFVTITVPSIKDVAVEFIIYFKQDEVIVDVIGLEQPDTTMLLGTIYRDKQYCDLVKETCAFFLCGISRRFINQSGVELLVQTGGAGERVTTTLRAIIGQTLSDEDVVNVYNALRVHWGACEHNVTPDLIDNLMSIFSLPKEP